MPVIVIANSKGGSGKTTAALLLACELAVRTTVSIIDADPRKPITAWAKLPGKPESLTVIDSGGEKSIQDEIEAASASSRFVIVDVEGTASLTMMLALSLADLAIVPMREQQQDAQATITVLQEIARAARAIGRPIPHAILFSATKVVAKGRISRMIADQFRGNEKINVFGCEINERGRTLSAIFNIGGSVRTLKSKDVNNIPGRNIKCGRSRGRSRG